MIFLKVMPENFATTQDRSNQACQRLHCVEIELYSVVTDSFLCVNTGLDTNNMYFRFKYRKSSGHLYRSHMWKL